MSFNKRRFESIGQAARAATELIARPRTLGQLALGSPELPRPMREKIMLAVTSVNRCRYCSFVHTLAALTEGFSPGDINALLSGAVDVVEEDEREALLYAQHWADTGGQPDPGARQRMIETYGTHRTELIETAIKAIMFGNYFGNTVDALLHTLSRGRLAPES